MRDGKVSIKWHCWEKEALSGAHGKEKIWLKEAPSERDGLGVWEEVKQCVGNSGVDVPDLQECKIPQKEVHGDVELLVLTHSTDNGSISHESQEVDDAEEHKQDDLNLPAAGKTQKDEFMHLFRIESWSGDVHLVHKLCCNET